MKVYVASLIGCPASGKTSLSRMILKLSREKKLLANVILICFDKLMKINYEALSDGDYKKHREEFFIKIENFLMKFKENFTVPNEIPIDDSHTSQGNSSTLCILDDNMYFRSMRQRSRQICKKCDCDHFQIYLETPLNEALKRNSIRSDSVDEFVIRKMFNDLEAPSNSRTIILELTSITEQDLLEKLRDRMTNPEILKEELHKIPQDQSIIHEMDLMSRKELSIKIQEVKSNDNRVPLKLNVARKQFMDDVRSEKLKFCSIDEFQVAFKDFLNLQ